MRRGSVLRVRLDPAEGSEQGGVCPVIVISPTLINERSPVLLVAPLTTQKLHRIYPFDALIDHEACGLDRPSKAMLNQLRTIDKRRILGTYGVADEETMASIDAAIRISTGLVPL